MLLKIFTLIIVVIAIYYYFNFNNKICVRSTIDNKEYLILRGDNKSPQFLQDSANTLATINQRMETLITYLDTNVNSYLVTKLKQKYNPYIISEAAIDNNYTTYTINKQNMHICLRTRDSNEHLYDINTLMYVVLHEAAHLANYTKNDEPIHGHGPEFISLFKFLVKYAIMLDLYNYVDYTKYPQEYCNIQINSNII